MRPQAASNHRFPWMAGAAFGVATLLAACKDAIDTLKQTVPLWKKEVYEGGEEWIGQGS